MSGWGIPLIINRTNWWWCRWLYDIGGYDNFFSSSRYSSCQRVYLIIIAYLNVVVLYVVAVPLIYPSDMQRRLASVSDQTSGQIASHLFDR